MIVATWDWINNFMNWWGSLIGYHAAASVLTFFIISAIHRRMGGSEAAPIFFMGSLFGTFAFVLLPILIVLLLVGGLLFLIWDFISTPKGEKMILAKEDSEDSEDSYLKEAQEEVEDILRDKV